MNIVTRRDPLLEVHVIAHPICMSVLQYMCTVYKGRKATHAHALLHFNNAQVRNNYKEKEFHLAIGGPHTNKHTLQ